MTLECPIKMSLSRRFTLVRVMLRNQRVGTCVGTFYVCVGTIYVGVGTVYVGVGTIYVGKGRGTKPCKQPFFLKKEVTPRRFVHGVSLS